MRAPFVYSLTKLLSNVRPSRQPSDRLMFYMISPQYPTPSSSGRVGWPGQKGTRVRGLAQV